MEILILAAIAFVLVLALASQHVMQIGLLAAWVGGAAFIVVPIAQGLWRWIRPVLGL